MGGGGGSGGSASVTVEAIQPGAAQVLGKDAAFEWARVYEKQVDNQQLIDAGTLSWQQVLAGLIGTYSIVQQYQLNERQVDLAERSVDQAEEYKDLAIQNYNEIVKVAFEKGCGYWDRFVADLEPYNARYMTDAFEHDEYTTDYAVQKGRALAGVQRSFDIAEKAAMRSRGPYHAGACCGALTRINIARGQAGTAAVNAAYRYEDAKKIELDQQYFQRKSAGMGVLAGISGLAGNMVTSGAGATAAGLNAIGQAVRAGSDAYGQIANALSEQRDFWGTIGNGAFRFAGYSGFNRAGWGTIQSPNSPGSFVENSGQRSSGFFSRNSVDPMGGMQGGKLNPSGFAVSDPVVVPPSRPAGYFSQGTFVPY